MTRGLRLLCATAVAAMLTATTLSCANRSRPATAGNRGQSARATDKATVLTRFVPYSAAGALTVPVDAHGTGRCWTASIVVRIPDAYRCLVGNNIADPCFAPPRHTSPVTVACVPDPWSGARLVSLTEPLPSTTPLAGPANPWAVELANGARCIAATGTVPEVDGLSLNLLCAGGMAAGGLDITGPQWRVRYGASAGGSLSLVAVSAAWRG